MALPFYSTTVDSVGRERTYWTVEGLRCSPNGAEVWKTDAAGAITGTLAFATSATVQLANGTAAAPPLTFASTTTRGWFNDTTNGAVGFTFAGVQRFAMDGNGINLGAQDLSWTGNFNTRDLILTRDAANILAQRNGTNAQLFGIYNTYTSGTNYEKLNLGFSGNVAYITTSVGASGTIRNMTVGADAATGTVSLRSGGSDRWTVDGSGHFMAGTDNTYDIGASGATRPRTGYFGTSVVAPTLNATTGLQYNGNALNVSQSAPANPTGTTDTTGKMMGLAVAFTPRSTRIQISVNGNGANNTINDGFKTQIRWNTGSAPANGDALTGTTAGTLVTETADIAGADKNSFSTTAIVTGLTAGTPIWVDMGLAAITGGTASITDLSVSIMDIP